MSNKILVASLGSLSEPIKTTLNYHQPEKVIFFASQLNVGQIREIVGDVGYQGEVEVVCVPNPNDLMLCFKTASCMLDGVNIAPDQVVVDITGGTKVMVAALAMAAQEKYSHLSYVNGIIPDNEGLGIASRDEQVLEFWIK